MLCQRVPCGQGAETPHVVSPSEDGPRTAVRRPQHVGMHVTVGTKQPRKYALELGFVLRGLLLARD